MGLLRSSLEPLWKSTNDNDLVDTLAEVVIWDREHKRHLLRSAIDRQFFIFVGEIDEGAVACTILQGQVGRVRHGFQIVTMEETKVWSHSTPRHEDLQVAIETCAGVGALGEGLEANGFRVALRNELRPRLCQLMNQQGFHNTIEGDVGQPTTIEAIVRQHPTSAMWTAGFPCQPWSWLGDKQGSKDQRASTLKSILVACYFCRAHTILLECVVGASQDKEIMDIIREWKTLTGFKSSDCTLELHHIWPSKRSRWWCLLTFPGAPDIQLEPFPVLPKPPVVNDVLPIFPAWPDDAMKQLILGTYETQMFEQYGGICSNVIDLNQPLKTALHAWGSQLDPCPCGCRLYPLALSRLQQKGLHGALLPLKGTYRWNNQEWPNLRHIHPWELALLVGLRPNKEWTEDLKLSITAVGQLASPLQSGWVVAQMVYQMPQFFGDNRDTPETILWKIMEDLFKDRDILFGDCVAQDHVRKFMTDTQTFLSAKSTARRVPEQVAPAVHDEQEGPPQREGDDKITQDTHMGIEEEVEKKSETLSSVLTRVCVGRDRTPPQEMIEPPTKVLEILSQDEEWNQVEAQLRNFDACEDGLNAINPPLPNITKRWQEVGGIPGFHRKEAETPIVPETAPERVTSADTSSVTTPPRRSTG